MAKRTIRANKKLIVVAYDVSDNKRRNRVVKLLLKYGSRINFSVFECMLSDSQLEQLKEDIRGSINTREDIVVYYPICVKCYSRVIYQQPEEQRHETVTVL